MVLTPNNNKSANNNKDLLNAESVMDFSLKLNEKKDYMKELIGMGALRDLFKEDFEERDNMIKDLSEQLQTKDDELKMEKEKNSKLQKNLRN